MPVNVSVGFKNDMSAEKGAQLGSGFNAFATGAVGKLNQLFDEERSHQQNRAIEAYKSSLESGRISKQLSQQEQIAIDAENRKKNAAALQKKQSLQNFKALGQSYGLKGDAADIYANMMMEVDPKIAAKMDVRFVDIANTKARAQELNAIPPQARTPEESQELKFYSSGGTASKWQENQQALAEKPAGAGTTDPYKVVDPTFYELTGGAAPNALAFNEGIMKTQRALIASGIPPRDAEHAATMQAAGEIAKNAGLQEGTPEYEKRIQDIVQYAFRNKQTFTAEEPASTTETPDEGIAHQILQSPERLQHLAQPENFEDAKAIVAELKAQGKTELALELVRKLKSLQAGK